MLSFVCSYPESRGGDLGLEPYVYASILRAAAYASALPGLFRDCVADGQVSAMRHDARARASWPGFS
jgi:hypothetical protein